MAVCHWRLLLVLGFLISAPRKGLSQEEEYDDYEEEEPQYNIVPIITSRPENVTAIMNETVRLPCKGENLEHFALLWIKNNSNMEEMILFTDQVKTSSSPRLSLDKSTLVIEQIQRSDAGSYKCVISALTKVMVKHHVSVLYPPTLGQPQKQVKVVKKGVSIALPCDVEGNPPPLITWNFKGKALPIGVYGREENSLTISNVSRHHIGLYECIASNGIGTPTIAIIELGVKYAPEIQVEQIFVTSQPGIDVELTCTVYAQPKPTVIWYFNDAMLNPAEFNMVKEPWDKYTLTITNVQKENYGNYTCQANNTWGTVNESISLSAFPSEALFKSDPVSKDEKSYKLVWQSDSYLPIKQFKLKYRPSAPNPSEWNEETIHPNSSKALVSYEINNLTPDTMYEATVRAENTMGWGQYSRIFKFSTARSEPESQEQEITSDGATWKPKSQVITTMTIMGLVAFFL